MRMVLSAKANWGMPVVEIQNVFNRFDMPRQSIIPFFDSFNLRHPLQLVTHLSCIIGLVVVMAGRLKAQTIIYDQHDLITNYNNACYDSTINIYPSIACRDQIKGSFNLLPIYWNNVYNSAYAKGMNDGPAWQGRGLNSTLAFGFSGRVGRLTYVISPMLEWVQNKPFYTGANLSNKNPFQYPFDNHIDWVMRYGNNSFARLFPGQSQIALDLKPVLISLSTQNMRWGPAIYDPIIMSTNAPGIPHLRVGTDKPIHTGIGSFEGNLFWGTLKESKYFNSVAKDNIRYFSGIEIGYRPSFFKGFSLGIQRVFYTQTQYLTNFFYDGFIVFSRFFNNGKSHLVNGNLLNDYYDQLASLTFRWQDPATDFQIYFEWAREDFSSSINDFIQEPDHSRGYTAGIYKIFHISTGHSIRFIYEHTSLAVWETSFIRPTPSFYTHDLNQQGYTNNGQIIGASIGPGSQADRLNMAYLWGKNSLTFEYQRTRYNDDYFYTHFMHYGSKPQDLENQVGLAFSSRYSRFSYTIGSFVGIRDSYLYNPLLKKVNLHTKFTLRYYFK